MTSGSGDDIIGLPSCEPEDTPEPPKKGGRKPGRQVGLFAGLSHQEMKIATGRLGGAMRAASMTPDQLSRAASKAGQANAAAWKKKREADIAAGVKVRSTPNQWGSRPYPTREELGVFLDQARELYPEAGEAIITRKAVQLRRAWLVRTQYQKDAGRDPDPE